MTTLEELEFQKKVIDNKIRDIKRQDRRELKVTPSIQQTSQENEFKRQQLAGLNPSPLVPHVNLESVVGSEAYERALDSEGISDIFETTLRGVSLTYKTPNRRALWQSAGQEHIEPELLDFIDEMAPGDTYYDIGASTGIFAIYAAAKGIQTICFEPEVQNFNLLNFNSYLNRNATKDRLKNFNIALSDTNGTDEMYISKFEEAGHLKILGKPLARGNIDEFKEEFRQSVLALRFDTFIDVSKNTIPTHLKIDIDGAERKFLDGMGDLLSNKTIHSIFIEILESDKESIETLDIIKNHGFKIEKKIRVQNYFGENNYILRRS